MKGDRERLQDLVREHEQHEQRQPTTGDAATGQVAPGSSPAPQPRSDSDQAQANLDRMLETGEENPIS